MGVISSIAEKAAVSAITTAFPLAGWLLKIFGAIESALIWWFSNLSRSLAAAIFVLLLLVWHLDSSLHERDQQIANQQADFANQRANARTIAEQALKHQNDVSRANAYESDKQHEKELADAKTAFDKYVASHRYPSARKLQHPSGDPSAAGQTASAKDSDDSAFLAEMSGDSVVVSIGDLHKCNEAVTYAIDAHNWSLTINP